MGGLGRPRVFVDANVLYSRTLRDWLGLLYTSDVTPVEPFVVLWSEDVLAEALTHLRKNHPTRSGGEIATVVERIRETFSTGRVRDYDVRTSSYAGPDPGDAHVHAAALAGLADYLLTANIRDFLPADEDRDGLPYEVIGPDDFFVSVGRQLPEILDDAIGRQISYATSRGREVDLCEALRTAQCEQFAELVLQRLQLKAMSGR